MTTRDEDGIGWELGSLLLAFAQRPRNWLVLARNLVPVVGIFALGWTGHVTVLFYLIDGVCLLALLIAALFIRGMARLHQEGKHGVVALVVQGIIGFALFFGLLCVPYLMVYLKLDLAEPMLQVSASRVLTTLALAIVFANLVGAFLQGGYFGMAFEEFRTRAAPEMQLLGTRGVAMVVLAWWTRGVLMAPLFAVVLTVLEVWPQVKKEWSRLSETPVA